MREARPELLGTSDDGTVFLTTLGERFERVQLTALVRRYVGAAKIGKMGGCHLWRHTVATMMLENGADIRVIQELIGDAKIAATHPGAQLHRPAAGTGRDADAEAELLSALAAEAAEEGGDSL